MNIKNIIIKVIRAEKPDSPKPFTLPSALHYAARLAIFAALLALSFMYSGLVRLRVMAYQRQIFRSNVLPRPVLSVGNITTGGTGKTPTVIVLARLFRQRGLRVAILTRGYQRKSAAAHLVVTADSTADEVGDEPLFLWKSLNQRELHAAEISVIVGSDRHASGLLALDRFQPDLFLLDDGFQHLRLRRDCDLVLIDATNPFGGGHVLPAGFLREPLAHLSRASAFVITRSDEIADCAPIIATLQRINPASPIFYGVHAFDTLRRLGQDAPTDLSAFQKKRLLAVCGLGNPASFHHLIRGCGLTLAATLDFRDHHWYAEEDIQKINAMIRQYGIDGILTTEKDEPKLQPYTQALDAACYIMTITMRMTPTDKFEQWLKTPFFFVDNFDRLDNNIKC
ncbi:LpxK protein [Candidatus Moduliflexus flocculans]|uniref:Tetraacyldisaccharide 4'-kinase n=1 Tax=Candidatus Moduliflexus flocculans TaxID=1499966 RepID=A0A081BQ89_9BACT|nr:LpxK protein [Candidatus Moduliflexus flocculans]